MSSAAQVGPHGEDSTQRWGVLATGEVLQGVGQSLADGGVGVRWGRLRPPSPQRPVDTPAGGRCRPGVGARQGLVELAFQL